MRHELPTRDFASLFLAYVLAAATACGGKAHTSDGSTSDGGDGPDARPSSCVEDAPCGGPCGSGRIVCEPGPRCAGAIATAGTVCRASAGPCDYEERCNGVRVDCPADLIAPAGEVCEPPWGLCNDRGECHDTEGCIPGVRCDSGDPCVVAFMECDGDEIGPCVPSGLEPPGTPCSLNGACNDVGECIELCVSEGLACVTGIACELGVVECPGGGGPVCVPTGPATAGTVCRPAASACDIAETCNGTSATCPPDVDACP